MPVSLPRALYPPKTGFSPYVTQSSVQDLLQFLQFAAFCIYFLLQNKFGAGLASDFKVSCLVFFFQEITFQGEYQKFILAINHFEWLFWACILFNTFYIRQSLLTGKSLPVFEHPEKYNIQSAD